MSPEVPRDPLIGQVLLTRYEIESRLGEGGMAVVYRARDLQLRRPVALKFVREGLPVSVSLGASSCSLPPATGSP